jgi:predicted RNA binding protein YcfA (HicA-like mRNA interferase family)|tara:strand:- start:48 stop:290 length:243 start_codon:yes stop_codon:yes gene_type:complete
MKLPRNVFGTDLAKALRVYGYEITRQKGSHIRVTTQINGTHHEVIPAHKPIKPGTLSSILKSVAQHHQVSTAQLIQSLEL